MAAYKNNWVLHRQRGTSLIEVLIAMVVISVGLLGFAGLQLTGMKGTRESHYRTKAVYIAEDVATRMRLNPVASANGGYTIDLSTINCAAPPAPYCQASWSGGSPTAACSSPVELATTDLYVIRCGGTATSALPLEQVLPQGNVVVSSAECVVGSGTTCYSIDVSWLESAKRGDAAAVASTKTVNFRISL